MPRRDINQPRRAPPLSAASQTKGLQHRLALARICAPSARNTTPAPGYPGSSIHTDSPGFSRMRAVRSSASCAPERINTCSAVHFTPRELFKYAATASRNGRYPSASPPASKFADTRRNRRAATCAHKSVGNRSSAGWFGRNARIGRTAVPRNGCSRRAYADRAIRRCGRRFSGLGPRTSSRCSGSTWLTYVPEPDRPST